MFIKTSIFKRILKDAWKGAGLTVGKKEEMYFIQGAYWILFVYEKDFTSKNKAAVIELVGDLPEEGEVYRAYEKGEKQYELKVRDEWEYKKWLSARDRYEDTEIKYRGMAVLQNVETKEMSYIPDQILELVSLSETGEYEDFPTGPMGMGYFVLWVNETGMLLTVKTPADEESNGGKAVRKGRCNHIDGYTDDLKWEGYTGGDIVKVYRITPESLGCIEDVFIKSNLELIWERTETKKMTIEEMRQKLEELTGEEIEVTA